MSELLISKLEAGRRLGVGQTKLHELINDGTLQVLHIGRRCLVKVESLRALVDGGPAPVEKGRNRAFLNPGAAPVQGLRRG